MIPQLYDKTGQTKICDLTNCIECLVEEERNGLFEVSIIYPNDEIANNLIEENIIVCNANDTLKNQKFRIYQTRKLMSNKLEILATHISFDLSYDYIEEINLENQSCEYALNTIFRNSQYSQNFKGHSDIINAQNYNIQMANCLEAIAGKEGSIIDTFGTGAEILRDNYNIHVLNKRGADNGVSVEYAKNLTGFELEEDTSELVTRILPYAKYRDEETGKDITLKGDFVDSTLINNYSHPYISAIDYSDRFEEDEVPTVSKLNQLAEKEYSINKKDIPKQTFKIEFIPLSKCVGYEGLEDKISLCDIVTIKDTRYNINTKAKAIRTVYDVLRDRYESIELGETRVSLGSVITGSKGEDGKDGKDGKDGDIENFPNSLPTVPVLTANVLGFASIELSWTFENKIFYQYEIYASKTKGFTPSSFDLIHVGQTSSFLYQAKPNETWYFRACAINSHGRRTEFSEELEVVTTKVDDMENYFTSAAIGNAVVGSLTADYMTAGILKGHWIDAKNLSVTDGNGKRTLDIDSFGNVSLDVSNLKIENKSMSDVYATKTSLEQTSEDFTFKISQTGSGNLLRNSDFYEAIDGKHDYWKFWGNCYQYTDVMLMYESFEGVMIIDNQSTSTEGGFYQEILGIRPNVEYTLSVNLGWADNAKRAYLAVEYYSSGTRIGSIIPNNVENNVGTRQSFTFTTPSDCDRVRVVFNHEGSTNGSSAFFIIQQPCLVEGYGTVWIPHSKEIYDGIVKIDKNGLTVQQGDNSTNLNSSALNFYNGDILYSRIRGGQFSFTDTQGNQVGWIGRNTWTGSGNYLNAINAEYDHCIGLGAKYSSTATVYTAPFWIASHDGNLTSSSVYSKQGINISDSWTHGAARFKGGNAGTDQKLRIYIGSSTNRGIISAASSVSLGLDVGNVFVSVADSSQTNGVYTNCYSPINMNGYAITNARSISTLTAQTDYTSSLVQKGNNDFFTYNNMSYYEGEIRWCWKEPVFTYAEADVDSETDKWVYSGRNICYIELPIFMAENIEENYHINISKISWGDYRIIEKTPYYFILESKEEDFSFTFEVVGKLIDSETTSANVVVANNYITTDNTVEEPYDTIGLEMP